MSSLAALLAQAVATWPERVALREDDRAWTYAQLWALSEPSGLQAGERVVLACERGAQAAVALWRCWRAGAVAVQLNPSLPEPELRALIREVAPSALLCEAGLRSRVSAALAEPAEARWVSFADLDAPRNAAAPDDALDSAARVAAASPAGPDSLATLVYTSGTTGQPKGVRLSHGNLLAVTRAIATSFELDLASSEPEVFAANLPLHYTYGRSLLLLAALVGGELAFTQRMLTPLRLEALCAEHRVTHLSLVPYLALGLLRSARFNAAGLPALRRLTVAGGALQPADLAALCERFPARVLPLYGLTEASTRLTCMPAARLAERPASCGRAIPGVELAIWSAAGEALPIGAEGEVVARGPNVSDGYFNDPELSARTFPGGWVRTGDLGVLDEEGFLTLRGRAKDLIKCMGERIAARAVEAAALTAPGVREAAAIGVPDPQRGEAVALFVVSDEGCHDEVAIRQRVVERLGRAAGPVHLVRLPELPRTGSGKVRTGVLRASLGGDA